MTNFGIIDLYSNGINIEIDGITVGEIKIPSDFVPLGFAPILGTHELLTGDKLVNGMMVVVDFMRGNPTTISPENPDRKDGYIPNEYDRARIMETARWALVTDLEIHGEIVKFTAIYSDGTMRDRSYNKSIKWAVLKEFEITSAFCDRCGLRHDKSNPDAAENNETVDDIFGGLLETIGTILFGAPMPKAPLSGEDAEIPADGQLPGESFDDFVDRMRDEAEANIAQRMGPARESELMDEENDAAIRFPRPRSRTLGSGRMVVNPKKTLVHFGSPVGTQFSSTDENPEWLF